MWKKESFETFNQKHQAALLGGGEKRIEMQKSKGKLTARERIDILFDEDTFVEVGEFIESTAVDFGMDKKRVPGDGVVTGYGKIDGRLAFVSSQDFTVVGGTLGERHSMKICRIMDMAIDMKAPFININDGGGARIEEGIDSLNGYSGIFLRNTIASGVIPQISVIMGPCAGGACYSPAISDFIFMTEENGKMFITGPQVIKTVTGEDVTTSELGSAEVHNKISGVAHFSFKNDLDCLNGIKNLLTYLPQNSMENAPVFYDISKCKDLSGSLEEIVPDDQRKVYDVRLVIKTFTDEDSFLEIQEKFAQNVVIGLARMDGETIGIVANQPSCLGGALDCNASDKSARFVRFCDCFNIPIITLVDVTGFLPGKQQEHSGIIRHGAKLLYAYSEATVPKITLITRKAFGGAYIAMNSKGMGADIVYAWPIAQLAVMGAEGAVGIVFKKQIEASQNQPEETQKCIEDYENRLMIPYVAAAHGYIDEIILPCDTKKKLRNALDMLKSKQVDIPYKKHGNIPL